MNKTKTENKMYPKEKKMPYPLLITGTPTKRVLEVISPDDGSVWYQANFSEKKFLEKYETDEEFKKAFDYAVELSVQERIIHGMFRTVNAAGENTINESEPTQEDFVLPEGVTERVDPETGEVEYIDSEGNPVDLGQQINISSVN